MIRPWVKRALFFSVLFVFASLTGGSAIWTILFGANDLTISNTAPKVTDLPNQNPGTWTHYGADEKGTRFSNADQINTDNVKNLEEAWRFQTGAIEKAGDALNRLSFQATPILIHDKLVFCSPFNEVIALNPKTGKELWRYDPNVSKKRKPGNHYTCRGVSYYQDKQATNSSSCKHRIFMGTVDARIISVDLESGEPCNSFGNQGQVKIEPSTSLRWPGEYQITSAPAIIGDLVITGSAISDSLRTEAPLGTVFAFDARTGEEKWQFSPDIRTNTEKFAHANAWSTISVDEKRGLVFLPTSSPAPDYYGGLREGDNRHANSVVALNAEDGSVNWAFQTVHHDLWDYDVPAQPGLYQVYRNGKPHDVVAQVTKSGLIFILDRDTGAPFLPIEEKPVPQGGVHGESLSPTQPFPTQTPNVVPDKLKAKDAFGLTLFDKLSCQNKIKSLRAEGLYTPPTEEGSLVYPFYGGGANWGSASYDASRNLLIVNMSNVAGYVKLFRKEIEITAEDITDNSEFAPMEGTPYAMERSVLLSPLGLPCSPPPWGILAAINLESGQIVWRKPIGTTEDLAGGLALKFGTPNIGGPMSTKGGLIFIGATLDNYIRAFDIENGKEIWKQRLPAGGQATPMTYMYDGKQYVVIAAGGHSMSGTKLGDYLIAYALPTEN